MDSARAVGFFVVLPKTMAEIPAWILALRGRMGEGSENIVRTASPLAELLAGRNPTILPGEDEEDIAYSDSSEEMDSEEEREMREWEREHVVAPEDEWKEPWSRSECDCEVCESMNRGVDEWASRGAPRTPLDRIMGNAVDSVVDHLRNEIAQHPGVDEPPL